MTLRAYRRTAPRLVSAAAAFALLAGAATARGQNVKELCATAYDQSQELRDARELVLARAQLLVCESACPAVLARDCTRWKADVDARLPTVVPSARDAAGHPVSDARLRIDAKAAVDLEPGKVIQVDVGRHTFRFERPDGSSTEVEAVLLERAKAVGIVGVFGDTGGPAPKPASASGGPPPLAYALGGVGLAALGVGGVLAIKGHVDRGALYDCRPNCPQGDVDAVATTWVVAGVTAGVGAAALAVAVWLWVDSDEAGAKKASVLAPRGGSPALRMWF